MTSRLFSTDSLSTTAPEKRAAFAAQSLKVIAASKQYDNALGDVLVIGGGLMKHLEENRVDEQKLEEETEKVGIRFTVSNIFGPYDVWIIRRVVHADESKK